MGNSSLIEGKVRGQSSAGTVLSVTSRADPSVQHLLDVISSIIAEEYIMIAKQNPKTFQNDGGTK